MMAPPSFLCRPATAAVTRSTRICANLCRRSLGGAHSQRAYHQSQTLRSGRSASDVAEAFVAKFAGKSFNREQYLDHNQTRLMSSTVAYIDSLNNERESFPDSEDGDSRVVTVPPGWHLSYFTPGQPLGELGIDGTDTSYNPDMPYTRRMWAGGSVEWPGADPTFENERGKLKLGWTATESTRVLSCTPKTIKKTGETMLVVGVEKEYLDEIGYQAVIEKRNWIFRRAFDLSKPAPPIPPRPALLDNAALEELSKNKLVRKFCRTTAELFRFSALTFNGHRIHYDREWAQQVEGHRNIVVHGPLNMVSILDFWRHAQSKKEMAFPKKLDYRATSAIYVDEPYRILIDADTASKKVTDVQVISDDGTICMTAQITNW